MLWTSLCSRLHLPISERALQLSYALVSRHDHRATPAHSIYTPFPLGSQSWCMNVCNNFSKSSVYQLCSMMPDPCEDATSAARLVSVISLLLLPTGVAVKNIGADDTIPGHPVSFSKAWLLAWRHRTVHSLFVASSKKKMSSGCGMRGQLQLRGQLSGLEREQQLLLKESIRLGSETV